MYLGLELVACNYAYFIVIIIVNTCNMCNKDTLKWFPISILKLDNKLWIFISDIRFSFAL